MKLTPKPVLKILGLADDDLLAIIHTDDIGVCQAIVEALSDLNRTGII